ncbi:MAG: dTMP kinase [Armatimonadota bacterium]
MPSAFITFEGPEGSGKSTQASMLAQHLAGRGLTVKLTREPGGDPVGEAIRRVLLDSADHSVETRAELLLYLAARAQHVERIIRPNLERGIVICDRYTDSTVAYQGYGGGLDIAEIKELNDFATGGLAPDLTLLLDIGAETGLSRQRDHNRMERKGLEYHSRVREGFLAEAGKDPRFVVIDASFDLRMVHRMVLEAVAERLEIVV